MWKIICSGGRFDASNAEMKAVLTPAFQLPKGIYYVEVSYREHGIAKTALIYEITDKAKGRELVGDDKFTPNPGNDSLSYRIRIEDDSSMRALCSG